MHTNYTNASCLAQDISIELDTLKNLVFVLWEFSDEERRDLSESKTAMAFLSRYPMQEALQNAVSSSVDNIAQNVESLVEMLMELDRQPKKEE